MPNHQLQHAWKFWELKIVSQDTKDYGNALKEVCEFNTIEDFWKYWSFIPKPSEIFSDGHQKKSVDGRMIKAFMVFKKGIAPTWEDPLNSNGSELVAVKSFNVEILDLYWENLVFGLIGETIDEGDEICGCRIVDQTRKAKAVYKIELWLKTKDDSICNRIKAKLSEVIKDGSNSKSPEFDLSKRNGK